MHLKNFSLIAKKTGSYELAPAYDILAVQLLMPEDDEELALTLNGKKKKIKRLDFDTVMINSGIPKRTVENLWIRIERVSGKE
jgi:serine/threonine-protein kinase HipA